MTRAYFDIQSHAVAVYLPVAWFVILNGIESSSRARGKRVRSPDPPRRHIA
jgi:hypothetical protein